MSLPLSLPSSCSTTTELCSELERLYNGVVDNQLVVLEPFASFTNNCYTMYLEEPAVHAALTKLLNACGFCTSLRSVRLPALPEPELAQFLKALSHLRHLRKLHIGSNASQSIASTHIVELLQSQSNIVSLKMETRIAVKEQRHVDQLAAAIDRHGKLQILHLHVLPRCSILAPTISFDALLQACRNKPLRSLRIVLGYEFNSYQQCMIADANMLASVLESTTLERLQLDNFGLGARQLDVIVDALKSNTTLQSLKLLRNPVNPHSLMALASVLENDNDTLTRVDMSQTTLEAFKNNNHGEFCNSLAAVRLQARLNRFQFQQLLRQGPQLPVETLIHALRQARDSLDVTYLLLQSHASMVPASGSSGCLTRHCGQKASSVGGGQVEESERSNSSVDFTTALDESDEDVLAPSTQQQQRPSRSILCPKQRHNEFPSKTAAVAFAEATDDPKPPTRTLSVAKAFSRLGVSSSY